MFSFKPIDSLASFRHVEKKIDEAVKSGELPKPEARRILEKARNAYRNQDLNRTLARLGRLERN